MNSTSGKPKPCIIFTKHEEEEGSTEQEQCMETPACRDLAERDHRENSLQPISHYDPQWTTNWDLEDKKDPSLTYAIFTV